MLTTQPFVGREQDDLARVVITAPRLKVVQVLADVDVQQQRLAAAGGIQKAILFRSSASKSRNGSAPVSAR